MLSRRGWVISTKHLYRFLRWALCWAMTLKPDNSISRYFLSLCISGLNNFVRLLVTVVVLCINCSRCYLNCLIHFLMVIPFCNISIILVIAFYFLWYYGLFLEHSFKICSYLVVNYRVNKSSTWVASSSFRGIYSNK